LVTYRTRNTRRIDARANVQHHSRLVVLLQSQIRDRRRGFTKTAILARTHNTDNLAPWSFWPIETQTLPERILIRKMPPHESFIHDHDRRMIVRVLRVEVAALHERDAHRLKILWTNHVRADRIVVFRNRA